MHLNCKLGAIKIFLVVLRAEPLDLLCDPC
jgi:hypothetical protein